MGEVAFRKVGVRGIGDGQRIVLREPGAGPAIVKGQRLAVGIEGYFDTRIGGAICRRKRTQHHVIVRGNGPIATIEDQRQQQPPTRHTAENGLDRDPDHSRVHENNRPEHRQREHQKDAGDRNELE